MPSARPRSTAFCPIQNSPVKRSDSLGFVHWIISRVSVCLGSDSNQILAISSRIWLNLAVIRLETRQIRLMNPSLVMFNAISSSRRHPVLEEDVQFVQQFLGRDSIEQFWLGKWLLTHFKFGAIGMPVQQQTFQQQTFKTSEQLRETHS